MKEWRGKQRCKEAVGRGKGGGHLVWEIELRFFMVVGGGGKIGGGVHLARQRRRWGESHLRYKKASATPTRLPHANFNFTPHRGHRGVQIWNHYRYVVFIN